MTTEWKFCSTLHSLLIAARTLFLAGGLNLGPNLTRSLPVYCIGLLVVFLILCNSSVFLYYATTFAA